MSSIICKWFAFWHTPHQSSQNERLSKGFALFCCARFPTDADWASQWFKRIKEYDPEFKREKMSVVCSLHFAKSAMHPSTRQLVDHAIPVAFPPPPAQPTNNGNKAAPTGLPAAHVSRIGCCVDGCSTTFDSNIQIPGFRYAHLSTSPETWTVHADDRNEVCSLFERCQNCERDSTVFGITAKVYRN